MFSQQQQPCDQLERTVYCEYFCNVNVDIYVCLTNIFLLPIPLSSYTEYVLTAVNCIASVFKL